MPINGINSSGGTPEGKKEIEKKIKSETIDSIFHESSNLGPLKESEVESIFDNLTERPTYEDFAERKYELRERMNALIAEKLATNVPEDTTPQKPDTVDPQDSRAIDPENPGVVEPEDPNPIDPEAPPTVEPESPYENFTERKLELRKGLNAKDSEMLISEQEE